ncbi:hypothetical protein HLB23_03490 [Nocardia uniformis]|uniref:Uncharacterized protein n=1 Tax=Nocardia uniformis TaxID=53432 RepID=A0A849BVI4_9NOCA|nr:hypothetical protein [Nocardia uniformis]NNH68946.1 hypothetical protein [Nocardia uniformis]
MSHVIKNVHERTLPTTTERVWSELCRLGAATNPIYPLEWGWVRFPEGIAAGKPMVHNNGIMVMNLAIAEAVPGEKLWFGDPTEVGPNRSGHGFLLEPLADRTRISHVMRIEFPVFVVVLWTLFGRTVHDETSEAILDNLERAITGRVANERQLSVRARIIRRLIRNNAGQDVRSPSRG